MEAKEEEGEMEVEEEGVWCWWCGRTCGGDEDDGD